MYTSMVTHVGPLATIFCEPRQARKGATVVEDSGAGVWLVWVTTQFRNGSGQLPFTPQLRYFRTRMVTYYLNMSGNCSCIAQATAIHGLVTFSARKCLVLGGNSANLNRYLSIKR